MIECHEVEFISTKWVERAACWPGLQVRSRPIMVLDHPFRRKTDPGIGIIERLLREALLPSPQVSESLQSIEPENIQPIHGNAVAQLVER